MVCAISALPVAISNLLSYLYSSYMALCGMIVCALAIGIFVLLGRWHKKQRPADQLDGNPFRVFVVVFSVLFVLSSGVVVYGLLTQETNRAIRQKVLLTTDEETVLKQNLSEHENAYNLMALGNYYLLKGGEDYNFANLGHARSYYMEAALKYGEPVAYIPLAKFEELGIFGEPDYAKALDYYIQGFYLSGLSGIIFEEDLLRLQNKHQESIPDSVLVELEKRKQLNDLPTWDERWVEYGAYLRDVACGKNINFTYVWAYIDGTSDTISYGIDDIFPEFNSVYPTSQINLTRTLTVNVGLMEQYKQKHNVLENMQVEYAYDKLLMPVWDGLKAKIQSMNVILNN